MQTLQLIRALKIASGLIKLAVTYSLPQSADSILKLLHSQSVHGKRELTSKVYIMCNKPSTFNKNVNTFGHVRNMIT